MKPRFILLTAGVAVAAWLAIFADTTPTGVLAEPMTRATTSNTRLPVPSENSSTSTRRSQQGHDPVILGVLARETLIDRGDAQQPQDRVFTSQTWTPPPPPKPPPPPPTAPPLPFTYLGKKLEEGTWEVYLARAEHTFIVRPQTVIEGTYRVDAIRPPTLSILYLPLNQMQTISIGGND